MRLLAGYIKFIVIFGHMSVYKATYVGYKVVMSYSDFNGDFKFERNY